ncbi:hypothetical protein V1511DRAFT_493249 [Dipodascopsis uninucleata]
MKVAFIHPDLGIGGAERLVVDAAVGLKELGHDVTIFTSRCDPQHCFEEVKDGSLKVVVKGDNVFPRTMFGGRFAILCAILRQLHLTLHILRHENETFDGIFVDQLAFCVPLLKYGLEWNRGGVSTATYRENVSGVIVQPRADYQRHVKIIFYCHFPDKLLAIRKGLLKRLYRIPFDIIEAISTDAADILLVNSKFTQQIFRKEFPSINRVPTVVYPCVSPFQGESSQEVVDILEKINKRIAISVNRFERKKGIELAIKSYAMIKENSQFPKTALIIAGGYDTAVVENVEYLRELQLLCDQIGLKYVTVWNVQDDILQFSDALSSSYILFLPSVSSPVRNALMSYSSLLLYTPVNEHFGIVPLEAMLQRLPVLATSTGGPLETVQDGITGWLREPDVTEWTPIINHALCQASLEDLRAMGDCGKRIVLSKFSRSEMATSIEHVFEASAKEQLKGIQTSAAAASTAADGTVGISRTSTNVPTNLITRSFTIKEVGWAAFLLWAVYYCKYGFTFTVPSFNGLALSILLVAVFRYVIF